MARGLKRGVEAFPPGSRWLLWVGLAALIQIVLGLGGLLAIAGGVDWTPPTAVRDWQRAVEILALGAMSAYLLLGAARDPRAGSLGILFLLAAVFYAQPPSRALAFVAPAPLDRIVLVLRSATIDAFTPAVAWVFVRDFPRALESRRSVVFVRSILQLSIGAALALIAVNLVIEIRGDAGGLALFDRSDPYAHYWTVVFGLLLPMLPFVLWRTRHAPEDERRRVALFAAGIGLLGMFPVLLAVLPPSVPALSERIEAGLSDVLIPINLLVILAMAATTAYSVAVRRVLDVRTVLRMAAQYGLARLAVAALAVIPFAFLVAELYRLRDEPVAELFSGVRILWIPGTLVAILAVLRVRRRVMRSMDGLFFREPYDASAVLASVAANARREGPIALWARSLIGEIDGALHTEPSGLLMAAADEEAFHPAAGALRRLRRDSALVRSLAEHGRPLRVELEPPGDLVRSLPEYDRVWLADAGAELLVPLNGSDGALLGILALGAKRSELPFSQRDLQLLEALGGAAAVGLENRLLRQSSSAALEKLGSEERATDCKRCGRVGAPEATRCPECEGPVRTGTLPLDLFGKFRLEQRIGEGGMGVVYRATDVTLGRSVALKTLPATRPEDAARLRREARAMASITHPNLALIFGAEAFESTPILVLEYLAGGTLEDRLASGPLPLREALDLAHTIANVLERAHGAGILHRDVKPSNIGYTDEAVPKLLDFGLARIAGDAAMARVPVLEARRTDTGFAGTPLYTCPEAFDAERPYAGFDLWSLGVVAFEAAAGVHPFVHEGETETLRAIRRGWTEEVRARLPGCPDAAAGLFARVLSADRGRRPATASEMAAWIAEATPSQAP